MDEKCLEVFSAFGCLAFGFSSWASIYVFQSTKNPFPVTYRKRIYSHIRSPNQEDSISQAGYKFKNLTFGKNKVGICKRLYYF